MDEELYRNELVRILQNAYSGELAAALAYRGHWKSLDNPAEIEKIQRIEREELIHRERVGLMLASLGEAPLRIKEIKMRLIGRTVSIACHFIGWFLPMYFAGRLETANVHEYASAALHASAMGLVEFEIELRAMIAVEKQHEEFFMRMVTGHPMLPFVKAIFKWGPQSKQGWTRYTS